VAVVTGATGGIGRALARGIAEAGARVLLSDVRGDELQEVVAGLRAAGLPAEGFQCDLATPGAGGLIIEECVGRLGDPEILVNNAGLLSRGSVMDYDAGSWDRAMRVNFLAVMETSRAAAGRMKPRGWGRIINIGSSLSSRCAVLNRRGGGADYCLAKVNVQALVKLLAWELAPSGITVNAVAPGIVDTPMHVRGSEAMARDYGPMIPLGRLATPEDIAGAVVFLASEAASYITGQTIHVNGGMIMVD
jgi:NAD(P)-dependent dehydrogenase (short-subunit alcohol dehydrogenase family)